MPLKDKTWSDLINRLEEESGTNRTETTYAFWNVFFLDKRDDQGMATSIPTPTYHYMLKASIT